MGKVERRNPHGYFVRVSDSTGRTGDSPAVRVAASRAVPSMAPDFMMFYLFANGQDFSG